MTDEGRYMQESSLDAFVRAMKIRGMLRVAPIRYVPLRDSATLLRTGVSSLIVGALAGALLGYAGGSWTAASLGGFGAALLFAICELETRALRRQVL